MILALFPCQAQKVGLVLSGGAASGIAHVGVIKALEENEIPIDYITGTSMGALIGSMYASGISIEQIEYMVTSEKFINMSKGEYDNKYNFYFKEKPKDASWVTLKFSADTVLSTSLPTSVISPVATDFELMELLSGPIAAANYNFDSLFIPFRCVASDIQNKESIIFRSGHLSQAVRASMSYPFYLRPVKIQGKILFDGGLYNNFPSDIMRDDFKPDVVIGCNVSYNFAPPDEEDILSQIKAMLVNQTDYSILCAKGVMIEPQTSVGTFEFSRADELIELGYQSTIAKIDEIKELIAKRVTKQELTVRRIAFSDKQPAIIFDHINIEGVSVRQARYVRRSLRVNQKFPPTIGDVKPYYFKIFNDDKINYIYPTAEYDKETGFYDLHLEVKKEKDSILDFGGNFSSRPINTGYIGLKYNYLGGTALSLSGNTYFGKLYSSGQARLKWDVPMKVPVYVEAVYTYNRWDYFSSSSLFFEDVKPSFLKQTENYGNIDIGFPLGNNGKIMGGISSGYLIDRYYQTRSFLQTDTTDHTQFDFNSAFITLESGSLNRKQYASKGTKTILTIRGVEGEEYETPGSTSESDRNYTKLHEWLTVRLTYESYYKEKGNLRLGVFAEGVYSSQQPFNNYTSSLLRAPEFQPNPESKTLFLENFRAYNYAAIGHRFLINFRENLELRVATYVYQPYRELEKALDGSVKLGNEFSSRYAIITGALVYHTPIGPAAVNINYYHNLPSNEQIPKNGINNEIPISFLFHFGYIIFNDRALE
ncbi:MAG: patatin-like phospholipase family protein [Flavobacteriales bacterium]|nr:patatin-like phospholipase family protein [Flavobacteriales bacterium]